MSSESSPKSPSYRALICLPDYGFDPTEAAVPFVYLSGKGCQLDIATQTGRTPACDSRMIQGFVGKVLGAKSDAREAYEKLSSSTAFQNPLSWTSPDFDVLQYDLLLLPGGHDKGVKQIIENQDLKTHLQKFFPQTSGTSGKVCGAICHGVMVLAWTQDEQGNSLLYDRKTTTLPEHLEKMAVYGTCTFLGDYYRTYPGTWTATEVKKALKDPAQFLPGPFNFTTSYDPKVAHVVVDEGYISARWPGDAWVWSETIWKVLKAR